MREMKTGRENEIERVLCTSVVSLGGPVSPGPARHRPPQGPTTLRVTQPQAPKQPPHVATTPGSTRPHATMTACLPAPQ